MKNDRCFTMIELLAVIVIILVLAGILIGGIGYATKKADVAKTQSKMMQLEVALDAFRTEYGFYPPAVPQTGDGCTMDFKYVKEDPDDDDSIRLTLEIVGTSISPPPSYPFVKRGTRQPLMEIGSQGEWSDSWGNPFQYKCPGAPGRNKNSYDLWSMGPKPPDGSSDNTDDDIANWKRN